MKPKGKPKAPAHLRPETRKWWLSVVSLWELEEHHVHLLTNAAEALDRIAEARSAIAADGAYFVDRFGARKPHPALATERDNRALFARLLRELDLDGSAAPEPPRPPLLARYRRPQPLEEK